MSDIKWTDLRRLANRLLAVKAMNTERDQGDTMNYIVIDTSPDGIYIQAFTQAELTKRLNEGDWVGREWRDSIPSDIDPNYWGKESLIVIKGEVIVPKAVQHVTEYEVP